MSTRLWVDGSLVAIGAAPSITNSGNDGAPGGSTPDLYIGANPQSGVQNREWWGEIDDVAQWDRVLAPSEIDEIFSGGAKGNSLGALIAIPEPSSASLLILVLGLVTGAKYRVARKTLD